LLFLDCSMTDPAAHDAYPQDVHSLEAEAIAQISVAHDLTALEDVRVRVLGKAGSLTLLLKSLGKLAPDERQIKGPLFNGARERLSSALATRKAALEAEVLHAQLSSERVDISLPTPELARGSLHPIAQVFDELARLFGQLGFDVAEGPEIESDWHNFTALNIPPTHPARAMHDTFYFAKDLQVQGHQALLRTHTSPVQIREMLKNKPPLRLIAPGRVYRCDSDATHTPMFHQVEGLVIDKAIHMGHLRWTLETFIKAFFEVDTIVTRFRPSFFPFTEPSAELDVQCDWRDGTLKVGEGESWLEILGCGMVHPKVLAACGLDPDVYQGFAFGCGIDRLAMLKYGITDLRACFDADLRWLKHYGFSFLDAHMLQMGRGA
jgi:phenylalanyl-tRNA synthetase alpha chain